MLLKPIAFLLVFLAASLAAQDQLTEIVGVVKDSSGGVLPGVTITLSGSVLPRPQNVTTRQDGTMPCRAVANDDTQ